MTSCTILRVPSLKRASLTRVTLPPPPKKLELAMRSTLTVSPGSYSISAATTLKVRVGIAHVGHDAQYGRRHLGQHLGLGDQVVTDRHNSHSFPCELMTTKPVSICKAMVRGMDPPTSLAARVTPFLENRALKHGEVLGSGVELVLDVDHAAAACGLEYDGIFGAPHGNHFPDHLGDAYVHVHEGVLHLAEGGFGQQAVDEPSDTGLGIPGGQAEA